MSDIIKQWLPEAQNTRFAGQSLAGTLYGFPVNILLTGELGAGKTTFLQGFSEALGIAGPVTSPTYALEQRYKTRDGLEFLHLDLYRLTEQQAVELVSSSDDHAGIRCIEWAERLGKHHVHDAIIHLTLAEEDDGRALTTAFEDIALPSPEEIERWRKDVRLPMHIVSHCRIVAATALAFADHLIARGHIIRRLALERAAQLHDLLRFVDFRDDAGPKDFTMSDDDRVIWKEYATQFSGMRHEEACTNFLKEKGYIGIAEIVRAHGLRLEMPRPKTIEQKLLYYADKRVMVDTIVTVNERFDDFAERYGKGVESADAKKWRCVTLAIENELFPDGAPF